MNALNSSVKRDFEWTFNLTRYSLELVGLWPKEISSARKQVLMDLYRLVNLLLIVFVLFVPSVECVIQNFGNLLHMIDYFQFFAPLLFFIFKFIVVWNKQKALLLILNVVVEDWAKSKTNREKNVMIRRGKIVRKATIYIYILLFISIIIGFSFPMLGISLNFSSSSTSSGNNLPLQFIYFYDTSKSPNYEITFFCQCVAMIYAGAGFMGINNLAGTLIFHFCGQLENLKGHFLNMNEMQDFDSILMSTVNDHTRIIRSVKAIEYVFNEVLLGWLLYFVICTVVYGILFPTVYHQENVSIGQIVYLAVTVIMLFMMVCTHCVVGGCLITESEELYSAIYNYNWEDLEPKQAKKMILLLARAQIPICITVGKLFPITIPTLCNILKGSISYVWFILQTVVD